MNDFEKFWDEQMKNPLFREEWQKSEPEYQVARAMIKARIEQDLTQKQLSERTGITQADISRIERGSANPSLNTLYRLAKGLGMKINISFMPDGYAVTEPKSLSVADP